MAAVELERTSVDTAYRTTLNWDLEIDFNSVPVEEVVFPLEGPAPLPGEWSLAVKRGTGKTAIELSFQHDGVKPGAFGRKVRVTASFFYRLITGEERRICRWTWARENGKGQSQPEEGDDGEAYTGFDLPVDRWELEQAERFSDGHFERYSHHHYICAITLEQDFPKSHQADPLASLVGPKPRARRLAGSHRCQLPHDIRLFFPHVQAGGAELWANSKNLSEASPYLKDLLSSDFAESKPRRSKRARTSGAVEVEGVAGEVAVKDFPDSDDETDAFLVSKQPPKLEQSSEADEVSYRQITITQSALSTYHAVLVFINTGFIHFTPLFSSLPSSDGTSRDDLLAKALHDDPSLPLPISPKSAYRLAHLLRLSLLEEHCLDQIRSSLSIDGVAFELFSEMSTAYDDFRHVVINYVLLNLERVRESASWKSETARMKEDDPARLADILLELFEAQDADDADKGGSDSSGSEN